MCYEGVASAAKTWQAPGRGQFERVVLFLHHDGEVDAFECGERYRGLYRPQGLLQRVAVRGEGGDVIREGFLERNLEEFFFGSELFLGPGFVGD